MELLQLTYFCDAAESENFSRTAEKYNVPPSNISQTVKRLEEELGVKLFRRVVNRIHLSDEGRIFYEGVKRALSALEEAKMSLCDSGDEILGEIKLLIRTNRRIVTRAIEEYKKLCPKVQLLINHDTGTAFSDYSFLISDATERREQYERELLLSEKIVLAVNKKHKLAKKTHVDLSELAEENFVSMSGTARLSGFTSALCLSAGFSPNVVISTDDPFYVRKYVDMNLGVTIVPSVSWRGMFSDDVVFLDIGEHFRKTYLYSLKGKKLSRAERLFMDILKKVFAEEQSISAK